MTKDTVVPSRREVLAAAAAGALGLAAARIVGPEPAAAASGDPLALENDNPTAAPTSVTIGGSDTGSPVSAFIASSPVANTGIGVTGKSTYVGSDDATFPNVGVYGVAGADPDPGTNGPEPHKWASGVYGYSNFSAGSSGVVGIAPQGTGVYGGGSFGVYGSGSPVGVYGSGDLVGVFASADAPGYALAVDGKVTFRLSGVKNIAKGKSSLKVKIPEVSSACFAVATLQTNRAGIYVQAAVCTTGYVTIYLNKAVPGTTRVAFLVLS